MKTVNFFFSTKLTFDDYVHDHSFALRVIPPETASQHILSCSLNISPAIPTQLTMDAFGNNVTSGFIKGDHRFLDFEIKGSAEVDVGSYRKDIMPCYRYQSEYTFPDKDLTAFYMENKGRCESSDPRIRAGFFSGLLSETLEYKQDITDTETTASEAFRLKAGVCQDFTHILISLLRMDGIPCRYIAGLAFCDGETHSWAEFWNGDHWEGIDPANNRFINDDYLVISQGRDFRDCAIDRGVMFGKYTRQLQLVNSVLT